VLLPWLLCRLCLAAAGSVSVLCATSTLAAGVNLPARRVIFKHAYVGIQSRTSLTLRGTRRSVAGAGRAGVGSEGESILLASKGTLHSCCA